MAVKHIFINDFQARLGDSATFDNAATVAQALIAAYDRAKERNKPQYLYILYDDQPSERVDIAVS